MPDLTTTQEWMAALVRESRSLARSPDVLRAAAANVSPNARLSPEEQLEIYREQFWLRHTASLLEDFPGLSGILGQADWERLVESYLAVVVPSSWTLRDLGYRLPEHVERAEWLPHRELCTDMARFEWAVVEVFDAADAPPLDPDALERIPDAAWETARIVLAPALALLPVRYPVAELRARLRERPGASVELPRRRDEWLVVSRDAERGVRHDAVPEAAFELLVALRDGLALGAAAERAAARVAEGATAITSKVGEWFSDFAVHGWVVDVETR